MRPLNWILMIGLGLLTACPTPPEQVEDADRETVAEEQIVVEHSTSETIIWCTTTQAHHSTSPQSSPQFKLHRDRLFNNNTYEVIIDFKRIDDDWCYVGGVKWHQNATLRFSANNQAALKANALMAWHAPEGAVVSQVIMNNPDFILQEDDGLFQATFVEPTGTIVIFQGQDDVYVPDMILPNSELNLREETAPLAMHEAPPRTEALTVTKPATLEPPPEAPVDEALPALAEDAGTER